MRPLRSAGMKLTLVGGGRIGEAPLGGLLASGWAPASELAVVEKVATRRDELTSLFPGVTVLDGPGKTEGAIIAVKPGDVAAACAAVAEAGVGTVLSIAAGVTIAALEAALGGGVPVVRAMPNTP